MAAGLSSGRLNFLFTYPCTDRRACRKGVVLMSEFELLTLVIGLIGLFTTWVVALFNAKK